MGQKHYFFSSFFLIFLILHLAVVEPNSTLGSLTEIKVKTGGEWVCSYIFFDVNLLPLKIAFYD